MLTLKTPLKNIPKILPKYDKILEKMELHTVEDLLLHFPFRYDDFSQVSLINNIQVYPIRKNEISNSVFLKKEIQPKSKLTELKAVQVFSPPKPVSAQVSATSSNSSSKNSESNKK